MTKKQKASPSVNWQNEGFPVDAANSLSPEGDVVTPMNGYYHVILSKDHSSHIVLPETKECKAHGQVCPAVLAVARYISRGGSRADRLDPASLIPKTCPICGGRIHHEPRLISPVRKVAWVCENSYTEEDQVDTGLPKRLRIIGARHYWQWQGRLMQREKSDQEAQLRDPSDRK